MTGSSLVLGGRSFLALVGAAITIKLMDDILDAPRDQARGFPNWSFKLGRSAVAYALLSFTLAVAAQAQLAVAMFLAAYGWGMADNLAAAMPSGLPGWLESVLALFLSWFVVGWSTTLFALCLVGTIHLLDDFIDGGGWQNTSTGPWSAFPGGVLLPALFFSLLGLILRPGLFLVGLAVGVGLVWLTRPFPWRRLVR